MSEVHEEKRTHKCEICDYTSFIKAKMDNHMESVHERKKKFQCEKCDKAFSDKGNMTKHIASVHEGKKSSVMQGFLTKAT